MKWKKGRQKEVEYFKITLYNFRIGKYGFDCYLLKYPKSTFLIPHKDPIDGKHYRINLTLKGENEFICEKQLVDWRFLHIFRPDLYVHSLRALTKTYKLSMGFAKFN